MSFSYRRVHIIGAGGAGMSALAKILAAQGHTVSGSDLRSGAALDALADLGISVSTGHNPAVALEADLVVASSAVPDYDEELTAARNAGIPTWRRPQLLEALTAKTPTIGATGTHGKTTTTAMMIAALRSAGLDPSFVLGGDLVDLGTNGHLGGTDLLVLEADEAFRTFESLHLRGLVVTNVEPEHLDHFGTEADLLNGFVSVAEMVEGPVISCLDDPGAAEVATRTGALTYGVSPSADWRVTDLQPTHVGSSFVLVSRSQSVAVRLHRPGRHMAVNAAGALALLAELGYELTALAAGIDLFRGVARRWQHRGTVGGVTLYDDYAHHPTEVRVNLEATRSVAPGRLWAVFQPHLYSRTERFHKEFGEALSTADVVVVTDVYGAREAPVPGVTGQLVAEAVAENGGDVHYVQHRSDLAGFLLPRLRPGDTVLTMGAGDITLLPGELASGLALRS